MSVKMEKQLDLIIRLLEALPKRLCEEFTHNEATERVMKQKEFESSMQFLRDQNKMINEAMGYNGQYQVIPDDPKDWKTAKQYEGVLNHAMGTSPNDHSS